MKLSQAREQLTLKNIKYKGVDRCWKKSVKAPTGNLGQARQRSGKPHRPTHRIFRSGKAKVRQAPPTPPPHSKKAVQNQSGKSGNPPKSVRQVRQPPKSVRQVRQPPKAVRQPPQICRSNESGNPYFPVQILKNAF